MKRYQVNLIEFGTFKLLEVLAVFDDLEAAIDFQWSYNFHGKECIQYTEVIPMGEN